MLLSLAPMEGITGYAFRRVHAEVFGALDRYYTPFISPLPKVGTPFSKRNSRELDPANNKGLNVVPQLLTNDADRFAWAAGLLADMGYKEVNLNLGCPSGTVVAKEKLRPFAQPGQARGVSGQRARTLAFACLGQNARRNRERRRVRRAPCAVLPLRNR